MAKKPQPTWRGGRQAPRHPDDFQVIEMPRATPLPESVLDRPLFRLIDGQLVKVADRVRDTLPPDYPASFTVPPDPLLPPPAAG